ncbi:MAG: hypothetical protein IRZ03_18850 [Acidobacterium ailaaui]|nr:hypothetical protein [Pseudacidobacterium ailaaui]
MDKQNLIEEYRERNARWTDRTLSQLSYYNNLLLSLGIGFLAFAYKMARLENISFSYKDIDWSLTMYVISLIMTTLSVLLGFIIALNRLYDFRITRQVNQVRQITWEHSNTKLDEETPEEFSWWKRTILIFKCLLENYPKITRERCKKLKEKDEEEKRKFNEEFILLRKYSHNLGIATWSETKIQTALFGLAIVFFVISELSK